MTAILLALVALAVLVLARVWLIRIAVIGLLRTVYSIRVRGLEHLPPGGAVLVANHLSFVDALLVGVAIPRKVRFLMHRSFFATPLVGRFASMMGALPVAAEDTPEEKARALQRASELAARGDLVCIFAEGGISRSGALMPFARGLERIAREARVPIVPVALDRVFGSIFSFSGGRVFWKLPQRLPYPIDVVIGPPLPFDSDRWRVRDAVQLLIAQSRERRAARTRSLGFRFLRSSRRFAHHLAVVDTTGACLSYAELLRACLVARSVFRRRFAREEQVGVLLPPGAGAVVANVGLTLSGKIPVNLNYTMSNAELATPLKRAGIASVVTSRRFLSASSREAPLDEQNVLWIEELRTDSTPWDRVCAALLSCVPGSVLARWIDPVVDGTETATVIFSSGSTGAPKGVELSHANIVSNVQSLAQMFGFGTDDTILGVLPFFHSFGYTGTLWIPLLCGGRVVYHANPLDAKTVGELALRERPTILLATPTFYQAYAKRCEPEQFASLRLCVTGAEKLQSSLADAWAARFGRELFEGYGCTEMSPVVSINVPDVDSLGVRQIGHKRGTVGRALPGVAVRIVDPESFELLPPDREGLVLVRGPNRMKGYLGERARTAEAIRDGWYVTGDLGRLDDDAFLVITERLARFSKIAGEMVPHGRVEEALHAALVRVAERDPTFDPALVELAVTALADEQRGERLIVLHTKSTLSIELWMEELQRCDLPRLFLPRRQHFIEVGAIPRLASGKTDFMGARELARAASSKLGTRER